MSGGVFLMEHPGALLPGRQPEMRDAFHNDMRKLVRLVSGYRPSYQNEFVHLADKAGIDRFFKGAGEFVALDLETTKSGTVDMVGVAVSATRAGILYLPEDRPLLACLGSRLASSKVVVHYGEGLECEWLDANRISYYELHDLHKLHHAWDPEYPHDLAFIQSLWSWRPYHKHWLHASASQWDKAMYCMTDCVVTWECFTKLYDQMAREAPEALEAYKRHGRRIPPIATRMRTAGWLVDSARFAARRTAFEERLDGLATAMKLAYPEAAPKGKKAKLVITREGLKELLLNRGVVIPKDRKTHRPKLDRDALIALEERYPDEPIAGVRDYWETADFLGDFYKGSIVGADGRCHPHWAGFLETWRWRCSQPNIAQHPATEREVFCAEPGKLLVQADTSGGELRWFAGECQDPGLLRVFDEYDQTDDPASHPHVHNTAMLFAVDTATAATWKSEQHALHARYTFSKNYIYRLMYAWGGCRAHNLQPCTECAKTGRAGNGGGVDALRATAAKAGLKFSRRDIVEFDRLWFDRHPVAARWRKTWVDEALATRKVMCREWGYLRRLHGQGAGVANQALNHPMQAGIAGLVNEVIVGLAFRHVIFPLANMHDGVIYQAEESLVEPLVKYLWHEFRRPLSTLGGIRIPVDISVGTHWGQLSKFPVEALQTMRTLAGPPR